LELKQRIQEDVKTAMRAGEKDRLGALRMITAAIKQREVDERIQLDEAQTLSVIEKMIKQRRESVTQYQAGGRQDLADQETFEIGILSAYLLAPRAGGTEVTVEGQEVMVITPQSPLGRQLIGHRQGDSVKIDLAGRSETHRIHRVS
jgi:uncharacterized protein YqeY